MFCCIIEMSFIPDARTCDGTVKIFRLSTFFFAFYRFMECEKSGSGKEAPTGFRGDVHASRLCALQELPVVAVGGTVMQFALMLDRTPGCVLGGDQQGGGLVDLGKIRAHGFDDGLDLGRMDWPTAPAW